MSADDKTRCMSIKEHVLHILNYIKLMDDLMWQYVCKLIKYKRKNDDDGWEGHYV